MTKWNSVSTVSDEHNLQVWRWYVVFGALSVYLYIYMCISFYMPHHVQYIMPAATGQAQTFVSYVTKLTLRCIREMSRACTWSVLCFRVEFQSVPVRSIPENMDGHKVHRKMTLLFDWGWRGWELVTEGKTLTCGTQKVMGSLCPYHDSEEGSYVHPRSPWHRGLRMPA